MCLFVTRKTRRVISSGTGKRGGGGGGGGGVGGVVLLTSVYGAVTCRRAIEPAYTTHKVISGQDTHTHTCVQWQGSQQKVYVIFTKTQIAL